MPAQGKRGGGARGRGGGSDGGRQQGAGPGGGGGDMQSQGVRRAGAGRGIPDYKDNPRAGRAPPSAPTAQAAPQASEGDANGAEASTGAAQKFNAQEAQEWMVNRFQAVMSAYEEQKQPGKKGDIYHFSDLQAERGWHSKPVIPPKEDFLYLLNVALAPYRNTRGDEQRAAS
mmetsp:Transcript_92065/g.260614  ORF Transcript_92065/g.260614 Transcript_92065/m.260614 type:complete len:172 (-) Transcript_92065:80-595(-)